MGYIYHFKCGCEIKKEDYVTVERSVGHIICAIHRQIIDHITFRCNNCGIITNKTSSGQRIYRTTPTKKLCTKCRKRELQSKRDSVKKKEGSKHREKYKKKIDHVVIKETKPDCKWYLTKCLPEICRDKFSEFVQCHGCTRYEKEESNIEDYVSCKSCYLDSAANEWNVPPAISDKWIMRTGTRQLRKGKTNDSKTA